MSSGSICPGTAAPPPTRPSSVADLSTRLLATLDGLGVQRFGYAGCALGGAVGIELALRHPERVASLALIAASPRFGTADEFRQRGVIVRTNGLDPIARTSPERWFTGGFAAAQPAITEWAVQMVRTTDPGCYIAACEALASFDVRSELARVGVPTLVLVGSDDQVTGPAEARTLVAGIPDARLAVVPGASHLVPVEQPAAVTDLLVRHFSTAWQPAFDSTTGQMAAIVAPPAKPVLSAAPPQPAPRAEIAPAAVEAPRAWGAPTLTTASLKVRREVLGDAHVDRALAQADEFSGDFQEFITRYAWGRSGTGPASTGAPAAVSPSPPWSPHGHLEELGFHTRAALRNGLTPAEIKEVLLQAAVYCGVPAANSAFKVAQQVIREETTPTE